MPSITVLTRDGPLSNLTAYGTGGGSRQAGFGFSSGDHAASRPAAGQRVKVPFLTAVTKSAHSGWVKPRTGP